MKKIISRLAIAAVIVFIVYNLIGFSSKSEITTIAQIDTIEIKFNFDGIVSRNEKIVTTSMSDDGWFDPAVSENEMVKSGKILGVFYDGDIDTDTKNRLSEINAQIDEANASSEELNLLGTSEDKIDREISEKREEIISICASRDMSKTETLRNELSTLLAKKNNQHNQANHRR